MDGAEPPMNEGPSRIAFDDVIVDLDSYELFRRGEPVAVEPQVFDVLCYLIEHRDRVVGKVELIDNVWGDRFVSESALTSRIKSARQAVGDDGRQQRVIRTTHGRGYRFVAELATSADGEEATVVPSPALVAEPVASGPHRSNVPAPARPLVARDRELDSLIELLAANRLVTVVGPGGVGKTRLATEVAGRWDAEFDDPVTFVALAPVAEPDEVFAAIRDALGIGTGGAVDAFGAVREALAGKSALLVLDNFEHVVEAAGTLADLVELLPGVRLLVTSRERLGLASEQVLELEPLSLPLDDLGEAPAITFFEHAVRGVRSDLELDASDREDIIAICRSLDALPLAIELAAAQTRYFSLSYLRSHLESAAMTVADHARDRPDRHHTMESTISWSYRLLSPAQQRLLTALSVYRGGWALDAAMTMGGSDGPAAASDLLALVDKSLVKRSTGAFGEPRFSMLRLVRDFAGAALDDEGGRSSARADHAAVLDERVRSLEARRWGHTGDGWIGAISDEYPDIAAALSWSFDGGDPRIGGRIVAALGFWWYRTGRLGEGRVWVERARDTIADHDDATAAWIHSAAGTLAAFDGQRDESSRSFETALGLARATGDQRLESLSLCDFGNVMAGGPGRDELAFGSINDGLDLARRLGIPQLIAHGLTTLGELSRHNGQPDRAEAAYREALELGAEVGDRHYEAVNTLNLGHALLAQDRVDEAMDLHRRGIDLAVGIGSRLMMAWNLSGLAAAHHLLGRAALAARLVGSSEATLDALGADHGPADQPIQDRRQAALADDLGADEYERLVGEGRRTSLEDAIDLAIGSLHQAVG